MTKKESKKVGFSIESVDTEDVKNQLLKKILRERHGRVERKAENQVRTERTAKIRNLGVSQ